LFFSVSGSLFGGKVMQKTGKYYWLTVYCLVLFLIGSIIIFLCSGLVFDSPLGLILGLCCVAFGCGATITTTLINVIANANPKDQAVATACTYLFRSLGSVVGVSMSATIVQQSLRTQLREDLKNGNEADEIVDRVRQSLDYIKTLEPHTRDIIRRCYQKATSASFGFNIVFVGAALVASLWIREKKLSK
jgi:MFS family permease